MGCGVSAPGGPSSANYTAPSDNEKKTSKKPEGDGASLEEIMERFMASLPPADQEKFRNEMERVV